MTISKHLNFIFFMHLTLFSWAQFEFNYVDSISVFNGSESMKMPWSGGLNYAQFSDIDYDFDGDMDLLVFDRSNNQLKIFAQRQELGVPYYEYDPYANVLFPGDLRYRVKAMDYDGDGNNDLFTYGIGGLKVYKNTGDVANGLSWSLAKELLYSDYWGSNLNLYVSSTDIPAIVDVDDDGDIDVLTFHIGGEYLQYHKNLSMELYGHADSLIFELRNECWGTFREDVSTNALFLNDNTPLCTDGNIPNAEIGKPDELLNEELKAHSGSSILSLDIDHSGVKDLVIGDVAFTNLNLLINGGDSVNTNSAMISVDPSFPSNSVPVDMQLFPAAFFVDVDFDGFKDLIVAPNAKNVSENETSVHKYKNTGTNENCNFVFETKSFLQGEMIEHGTGSIPKFIDIDNDGLLDMFVGNFFSYKPTLSKESRIAYYKNTGTLSNPVFQFIDSDFNNLTQLNLGLRIIPAFGDLNSDGKCDMIIGRENGNLVYFENNSLGSSPTFDAPIYDLTDQNGSVIHHGLYASPELYDLNKDGLLDLILGVKTGELIYYENTGTATNPVFSLVTDQLGNVDVSSLTPDGYSTPSFFSLNDTTYAMIGCAEGNLKFIGDIDGHIGDGDSFTYIDSNFLNIEVGGYSSAAVVDIDNDSHLDMFIGQDLGGVFHLEDDPGSNLDVPDISVEEQLFIYPNPFENSIHIKCSVNLISEVITITDLTGKTIRKVEIIGSDNTLDLSFIDSGIYILYCESTGQKIKVIKR